MRPVTIIRPAAPVSLLVEAALLPLALSGRPPPGGSRSPPSSPTNTNLDQDLPMNPTLRSVSLPSSTNHTNNHKESVMNLFRSLSLLALLVIAPVSAFAATSSLNINITVTITATNAAEWTNADGNANVTGQREWTITGATVNTPYASTAGVVTGPAGVDPSIGVQATALNFTNRGNIAVLSSVTVANGTQWNFGAAQALDVFKLEASVNGGAGYLAPAVSGGAQTLVASQVKDANCALVLKFTTPTSISLLAKVTSAQVVTILLTQN